MSGAAKAALSSVCLAEFFGFDELDEFDSLYHQLRDSVSPVDDDVGCWIHVYGHEFDLSAITGIDQAGRVDEAEPLAGSQAAAWLDEPGISRGDLNGDAGSDECSLARRQGDVFGREKVQSRVTIVSVSGSRELRIESLEVQDHFVPVVPLLAVSMRSKMVFGVYVRWFSSDVNSSRSLNSL